MRILFVLPGAGGGGGAHSVVQESLGLQRIGARVSIAISSSTEAAFTATYPELKAAGVPTPAVADGADLARLLPAADLAIATTAPSANLLGQVLTGVEEAARPRAAYYIQDYEPLFFSPGVEAWKAARASYSALPRPLLFAKTDWLCAMVYDNHGKAVVRVEPSLDHEVYRPDLRPREGPVSICAMIRPKTPRRAPKRTMRVLEQLAARFGDGVRLTAFGCEAAEIDAMGLRPSQRISLAGVLSRTQMAELLRKSDLFLDLSDYQAFGRTGLESMACGCTPVLPLFGGAGEFARNRENAYLVDTRSDGAVLEAVSEHLAHAAAAREAMRRKGVETALGYSIERAAFSEYRAFRDFLG